MRRQENLWAMEEIETTDLHAALQRSPNSAPSPPPNEQYVCVLPSIYLCQGWWKLQPLSPRMGNDYPCVYSGSTGCRHLFDVAFLSNPHWDSILSSLFCPHAHKRIRLCDSDIERMKKKKSPIRIFLFCGDTHTRSRRASQTEVWMRCSCLKTGHTWGNVSSDWGQTDGGHSQGLKSRTMVSFLPHHLQSDVSGVSICVQVTQHEIRENLCICVCYGVIDASRVLRLIK